MTKGDLSGHVKSYHTTIIEIFAFSYGDEKEKATLLKTAPGRPPRARWGPWQRPTGPSPPGTRAPTGPRPARARPILDVGLRLEIDNKIDA